MFGRLAGRVPAGYPGAAAQAQGRRGRRDGQALLRGLQLFRDILPAGERERETPILSERNAPIPLPSARGAARTRAGASHSSAAEVLRPSFPTVHTAIIDYHQWQWPEPPRAAPQFAAEFSGRAAAAAAKQAVQLPSAVATIQVAHSSAVPVWRIPTAAVRIPLQSRVENPYCSCKGPLPAAVATMQAKFRQHQVDLDQVRAQRDCM